MARSSALLLGLAAAAFMLAAVQACPPSECLHCCQLAAAEAPCNVTDIQECGENANTTLLDNTDNLLSTPSNSKTQISNAISYLVVMKSPCIFCDFTIHEIGMYLSKPPSEIANITFQMVSIDSWEDPPNEDDVESISPISPPFSVVAYLTSIATAFRFPVFLPMSIPNVEYIALKIISNVTIEWNAPESCDRNPSTCATCADSLQRSSNADSENVQYNQIVNADEVEENECWYSIRIAGYNTCASPSPSATQTSTPSPSPSTSVPASPSATPSASQTAALTPSPSPSSTASPSPSVSPSPSSAPCIEREPMVFFSNLDPAHPTLGEDALIRGAANVPVAITFTPPCTNCSVHLHELAVVLQAENDTVVTFDFKLCQYYSEFFVTCPNNGFLHTPPLYVYQAPVLYRIPLNVTYYVPHGFTGDFKLFLRPSANILWRLSQAPPAIPRPGLSSATNFLVRPPCTNLVQIANSNSCVEGPDWSPFQIYPSVHLTGWIPCDKLPVVFDRAFVFDPVLHPQDQHTFVNVCEPPVPETNRVVHLIDTTIGASFLDAATINTLPAYTYTVLFDRPCASCAFTVTSLSVPLGRLAAATVNVQLFAVTGPDAENLEFTPVGPNVPVAIGYGANFYDIIALVGFNLPFAAGTGVTGFALSFSAPLLWHYGISATSVSLADKPVLLLVPVVPAEGGTRSALAVPQGVAYFLPGMYVVANGEDIECSTNGLVNGLENGGVHENGNNTFAVPTPIPCFGTGSIPVVDNTLTGRYLTAGGSILRPFQNYLITFDLPCTRCNVHLTHLSLPLQRIASNHVRLNLSLALLHRTPVPAPGLAPFLDVLDPALVKTTTSWNLPSPLALYTFLLPQSFTAVDRSNETLQYGIIFSVSAEVVWRHGLSTSANTFHHIVGPTFGLYEELPPVVAVNGAWRATAIRPAVWLRSWAEPFWDCLQPSHSPAASCIPRPARRMLEAAGMNEDSLSLDRLVGLNSAVDRQLTGSVQYCSATPAPHSPAASASRHPAASPSSSRQPGSIAATGRIHFDLLFQITIVSASDFHAGSPLLEELRLSISLSLNINSLLVEVSVVSSPARMLGAAAAAPASLGRTHAAAAARRLTGTENVLRIRVSIITTVSLDINEIRDANEALQNRLLSKSLAELLSYFLNSDAAHTRNLALDDIALDSDSVQNEVSANSNAGALTPAQKGGIAGGVVGGVVLVALAVLAVVAIKRNRTEEGAPAATSAATSAQPPAAPAAPVPATTATTVAPPAAPAAATAPQAMQAAAAAPPAMPAAAAAPPAAPAAASTVTTV